MGKYFISPSERKGSCYFEFFAGTWDQKKMHSWHRNSICITDYDWSATGFESLVADTVDDYDPYGYTAVTKDQWDTILQKAEAAGGELYAAVIEAAKWAAQNFLHHKVFTILGI